MDQPETTSSGIDLREYLSILRSRKWTIILTVLVLAGAMIGYSYAQTPLYTAEARVLVKPISTPGGVGALPVDVQTESQVVASEPVAEQVQEDLGTTKSVPSLLAGLEVTGAAATQVSFSSAQVLVIAFTDADQETARDAANSFAAQYVEYRKEQSLKVFTSARAAVQRRIDAASSQLQDISKQLEVANRQGDQSLITTLETQRGVLIARLGVLQQRLDDLQPDQTVRTGGAEIIASARTPTSPSSPSYIRNALLGVILGLVLGIAAAFLRERLDDRFRGRADVETALGAPVLGTVPKYKSFKKKTGSFELISASDAKGLAAEAYRTLRTNLEFITSRDGLRSVVVTSPSAGEGKTATTANLGVVLAQAGRRVILVSADLRRPTLERYFNLSGEKGLSTFLSSRDQELWPLIQDPGVPNLRVIAAGRIPDNPAELLTSSRLVELVRTLEANADVVLIDSPPVLAVADAAILAARSGGAVVVIDASSTHRSATVHAKEEMERGGGRVIGSILNAFDPSASPYYYASYYSSGYESHDDSARTNGKRSRSRSEKSSKSSFGFRR
ncbi:MAG TPA: polysaccharide biosynthesis tyrosine autokinase [Actinomycetota bacterium]|jgi:non-specific protein-tyrosine kinase